MLRNKIAACLSVAVMILVLGIGLVLPGSATATSVAEAACSQSGNNLGFTSHGACVSFLETFSNQGNDKAVAICKAFASQGPIQNVGFKNSGDCVTTLRRLGF